MGVAKLADPFESLASFADDLAAKQATKGDTSHPGRSDFAEYLRAVARDDVGNALPVDDFTRILASTLEHCGARGQYVACATPPGLGKSVIGRQFFAWEIGRNVKLRTVVIGGDETSAENNVKFCRDVILSKRYRRVFPEAIPDFERSKTAGGAQASRGWRADQFYLVAEGDRKDPTMAAVAKSPQREDMRVDMLLADDIVGGRISKSPAETKSVEDAFWGTWIEGRLSNGGWCLYLQNIRAKNDLAHKLRDDPRFCSLWIHVDVDCSAMRVRLWNAPDDLPILEDPASFGLTPVDSSAEFGSHHEFEMALPVRINHKNGRNGYEPETLRARNPAQLRTLWQGRAANPEDLMFPHFAQRRVVDSTPAAIFGFGDSGGIPTMNYLHMMRYAIAGGLDWSGGKRRGKALTFIARDRNTGRVAPIYHKRFAGDITVVAAEMEKLWAAGMRWTALYAESNAVQDELNAALRAMGLGSAWAGTIIDFQTTSGKWDMEHGLPEIDVLFRSGTHVWPGDTGGDRDWKRMESDFAGMVVDQAKMTPDSVMSYWFAHRALVECAGANGAPKTERVGYSKAKSKYAGF